MDINTSVLAVIILLAINAFFVAAEFALVKARGFRVQPSAQHGGASVKLTVRIQKNLEAYLAVCQLGITMASLGLGCVGALIVAAILEPQPGWVNLLQETMQIGVFLIGLLVFSSLHFVVGEQVPKTLAIRNPEPIALAVAYPLHWAYLVFVPLIWLLEQASSLMLRMLGIKDAANAESPSAEESKGLLAVSGGHGETKKEKGHVLRNLFEFDQREVGSVMISLNSMHVLDNASPLALNMKVIRETGHTRFPLIDSVDDNEIKGVVSVKDLNRAVPDGARKARVDLARLARDPLIVPVNERVTEVFDLMRAKGAHMALVIDEYGDLAGLVTLEDLLKELVGEICEEKDSETVGPVMKEIGQSNLEFD